LVIIPFPYSDLSVSKIRPAIIIADLNNDDFILAQITSQNYDEKYSVKISQRDLISGILLNDSFVKFSKIFTADKQIISKSIGKLKQEKFKTIIENLIDLFERNLIKNNSE
jgi:mRNA interferase MazF